MPYRTAPASAYRPTVVALWLIATLLGTGTDRAGAEPSALRKTPIVRAVERAGPSVVSIHGAKTLTAARDDLGSRDEPQRVNGMGTGVVVDERGYIITNDHVVDGVSRIHVTLADGKTYIAQLINQDQRTDLAMVKIDVPERLPVITIGTATDLMVGEPVIAVGNAFGYEHTVTCGLISALHRTVQINDSQTYEDLIQTDASINPGNSGGPLLNIEGEMIGINVATRSGAQGIGFAIPVDAATEVAADLLSIRRLDNHWHGVVARKVPSGRSGFVVEQVEDSSPAAEGGLQPGDEITAVETHQVARALDFERALLGRKTGEPIELVLRRSDRPLKLSLILASPPARALSLDDRVWDVIGLRLRTIPASQLRTVHPRYRGGLRITAVRPDSPADEQGIRTSDILVGMHIWETVSLENVAYVLKRIDENRLSPLKFWVLRGNQPFFGYLTVADRRSP